MSKPLSSMPLGLSNSSTSGPSSSFAQILNRTQQNLNKINQKYASANSSQATAVPATAVPRFSSVGKLGLALDDLKASMNNNNEGNNISSFPPSGNRTMGKVVSIDENVLGSILDRLLVLEARSNEDHSHISKISYLEKQQQSLEKSMEAVSFDCKDLQRQVNSSNTKINGIATTMDHIHSAFDSKSYQQLTYDNWMKDMEQWRMQLESQVISLARETAAYKLNSSSSTYLTTKEHEGYKEKLPLLINQQIHSILNLYQENLQNQIMGIERRLQGAGSYAEQGEQDSAGAHPTSVTLAPTSPVSENYVQAIVAKEVLFLQNNLEERLQSYLKKDIEHEIAQVKNTVSKEVYDEILSIQLDSNTFPPSSQPKADGKKDIKSFLQEKLVNDQEKLYQYEQDMANKYHKLNKELQGFIQSYELDGKTSAAKLSLMENKLENLFLQYTEQKQTVEHKQVNLQQENKNTLIACKDLINQLKDELSNKIYASSQDYLNERSETETRLRITEKLVQDCLYHLQYSHEVIDKKIQSNPIHSTVQQSLEVMKELNREMSVIKESMQKNESIMMKVQGNTVLLSDFLLVKEKVFKTELMLKSQEDSVEATKRLVDSSMMLNNKVSSLELSQANMSIDIQQSKQSLQTMNSSLQSHLTNFNMIQEDIKTLKAKLSGVEKKIALDFTHLQEGHRGLGQRQEMTENLLNILSTTHNSEIKQIYMQLQYLEEKIKRGVGKGAGENFSNVPSASPPSTVLTPQVKEEEKRMEVQEISSKKEEIKETMSEENPEKQEEILSEEHQEERTSEAESSLQSISLLPTNNSISTLSFIQMSSSLAEEPSIAQPPPQSSSNPASIPASAPVSVSAPVPAPTPASASIPAPAFTSAPAAASTSAPSLPIAPTPTSESVPAPAPSPAPAPALTPPFPPVPVSPTSKAPPKIPLLSLPAGGGGEPAPSISRSREETKTTGKVIAATVEEKKEEEEEQQGESESEEEEEEEFEEIKQEDEDEDEDEEFNFSSPSSPPAKPSVPDAPKSNTSENNTAVATTSSSAPNLSASTTASTSHPTPGSSSAPPISQPLAPTVTLTRTLSTKDAMNIAVQKSEQSKPPLDEDDEFDFDDSPPASPAKAPPSSLPTPPLPASSSSLPPPSMSTIPDQESTVEAAADASDLASVPIARALSNDMSVGSAEGASVASGGAVSMRERLRLRQEQLRMQRQGTNDNSAMSSLNVSRTTSSNNLI